MLTLVAAAPDWIQAMSPAPILVAPVLLLHFPSPGGDPPTSCLAEEAALAVPGGLALLQL